MKMATILKWAIGRERVDSFLRARGADSFTADDFADSVKMSRSTAYRYLEKLLKVGLIGKEHKEEKSSFYKIAGST